jgi:hypothetical protein
MTNAPIIGTREETLPNRFIIPTNISVTSRKLLEQQPCLNLTDDNDALVK